MILKAYRHLSSQIKNTKFSTFSEMNKMVKNSMMVKKNTYKKLQTNMKYQQRKYSNKEFLKKQQWNILKEEIPQKSGENDFIFYNNSKMMQIQAQNTQELVIKMKMASTDNQLEDFYRQNSKLFSKIIKNQKNKFSFGFQHENSNFIVQLVKLVFILFEKAQSKALFPQLIVLLNNVFNLDNRYMEEFLFNDRILISIRKYFEEFCHFIQNQREKEDISKVDLSRINFQLYSIIYFIAILICQNNKKQVHSSLKNIFFTNTFIKNFLSLEISICKKNQIYKLISIILVFLVKKIDLTSWYSKIKHFILLHINKSFDKKSQFNFIYCLRTINSEFGLELNELKKYQIIPFLVENLKNYIHEYHLTYTLDLMRLIIKKNPILGYKFVNCGLLQHLKNNFINQANLVTCIFEELKDSIESQTKSRLYAFFEDKLENPEYVDQQKYILKCLIMFFPFRQLTQIMKSFENGLLDKISQNLKSDENIRLYELSFQLYEVILDDIKRKADYIYPHVLAKIECLRLIQASENSNQMIIKDLALRFKNKYFFQERL